MWIEENPTTSKQDLITFSFTIRALSLPLCTLVLRCTLLPLSSLGHPSLFIRLLHNTFCMYYIDQWIIYTVSRSKVYHISMLTVRMIVTIIISYQRVHSVPSNFINRSYILYLDLNFIIPIHFAEIWLMPMLNFFQEKNTVRSLKINAKAML
jgi:hypothetical protein